MMMPHLKIIDGVYGKAAIAKSAWSDNMTDYVLRNDVVELDLNSAFGWKGNDLSFLARLSHLKSFSIADFKISSVEPIHFLHDLRYLGISTYCKTGIRFSEFPKLERCGLEWRPRSDSLFDRITLKELFLNRYKEQDCSQLAKLTNLTSLRIYNSSIKDLHDLAALQKLQFLHIANFRGLTSIEGIERLVKLESLKINGCRSIRSIEPISTLSNLKALELWNDGDIESLKPMNRLQRLENVFFPGDTNILDGDLSALLNQKKLAQVAFKNRRHYSLRSDDLRETICARSK